MQRFVRTFILGGPNPLPKTAVPQGVRPVVFVAQTVEFTTTNLLGVSA